MKGTTMGTIGRRLWGRRGRFAGRRLGGLAQCAAASAAVVALLAMVACGNAPVAQRGGDVVLHNALVPADSATTPTATATGTSAGGNGIGWDLQVARWRATADAYLAHMTLDEKIGEMMLLETYYTGDINLINSVGPLHLGAVVIYNMNFQGLGPLRNYISALQAHASLPMLISADEEGGSVDRLALSGVPWRPAPDTIAKSNDPHQAYYWGAKDAQDLLAEGINTDLAPVVDVRTTWAATEGTRLWGNNPGAVDRLAGAFLQGLQDKGEIACLKHWPGIGSLTQDPHATLPVMNRTRDQMESTEFAAFRGLLAQHPGMIMTTHVIVPAIDPRVPADLSPAVTENILRGELHYDGVIMSDSLHMAGIAIRYSLGEATVLAVLAGNDLIEGAYDPDTLIYMESSLRAAVDSGRVSHARIDQAVRRILMLKARYGLLPLTSASTPGGAAYVGPSAGTAEADLPRAQSLA
jgi:beta-N-acetylhexosaminidase